MLQDKILKAIYKGLNEAATAISIDDIDFDNSEVIELDKRNASSTALDRISDAENKVVLDKMVTKIIKKTNIFLTDFEQLYNKLDENPRYKYVVTNDDDIRKFTKKLNKLAKGYKAVFGKDLTVNLNWMDVSNVTNFAWAFTGCKFDMLVDEWNTSRATNMTGMFQGSDVKCDLSRWNVSNVERMNNMFASTKYFNGDISNWNTHKCQTMISMFAGSKFNGDISKWDTSNVTDMTYMFQGATKFNQDISGWNLSSIDYKKQMYTGFSGGRSNFANITNYARDLHVFDNCPIDIKHMPKFKRI